MCIRGQLFSLSKSLFMRLVYSGFNEAQDNATKRQENEGNVAVYILKHHRKTTRQIKRKRKQQIVIGTRKLSGFLTTTSSFMTFVEFHGIFSSALQIADLVSLNNSFRWSVMFSCLFLPLEGSLTLLNTITYLFLKEERSDNESSSCRIG